MAYNRIFWAIQALGIAPHGSNPTDDSSWTAGEAIATANFVSGVQSVGITSTFNLEQVFELGQLALYEDVEEVPDVEVTIERVIDKHRLLYSRCAASDSTTISGMQNKQVDLWFSLTDDVNDDAGDANPTTVVHCSGMYMSSASFNLATDGNLTESVTMVGNHKKWHATPGAKIAGIATGSEGSTGNVMRRQNVTVSNTGFYGDTGSDPKITSVTVSVDFGREQINVLGKRLPYYRYVTYPVEVTTEVEVLARGADNIDALPESNNLTERAIAFKIGPTDPDDSVATIDLGSKNKLTSVTWGGGDTGGANATITYSYRNFNELTVTSNNATDSD